VTLDNFRFNIDGGKVAVVTGGAKGIGRGIGERLARKGVAVALLDRDVDTLHNTVQDLVSQGLAVRGEVVDLGDSASVARAAEGVLGWKGQVDYLVNNAGILRDMRFLKMQDDDWDLVIDTNLRSQFLCCRAFLPGMVQRGYGRIVNMGARAWLGSFGQANYSAAKGGIVSLTRSLAIEFAGSGITVNTIAPGIVDTPLFRNFKPEVQEKLKATVPAKRIGTTDDVGGVVEFFLGPDASYVTGQTLYVCGGRSLSSPNV
jgi:3-oxoacyl-[acyl-carrier protein] reductase